ncbi:hypothetical protein AVEN_34819-1, partial [Araneus ventricosus]
MYFCFTLRQIKQYQVEAASYNRQIKQYQVEAASYNRQIKQYQVEAASYIIKSNSIKLILLLTTANQTVSRSAKRSYSLRNPRHIQQKNRKARQRTYQS